MATELNKVEPDFESIVEQLEQNLQNRDAWKDILAAGTGQTIIEFIAAATTYDQHSIIRAVRETMLDTARIPSSIYTIARMLGVHIVRKQPARVEVQLSRQDEDINNVLTIPKFSEFVINEVPFFNREEITFSRNQRNTDTELFQGFVFSTEFISDGTPFQRFVLGESGFNASDSDVTATSSVDGKYTPTRSGLWHFGGSEKVFFESTLPNGDVEIYFGNDVYGKVPPQNSTITFTYAWTFGRDGNDTRSGFSVTSSSSFNVTGETLGAISGGDDENTEEFYRILAPDIYSARERVVTRKDHRAITVNEFPGVLDAIFRGQQELNPSNKNFMNVVYVTLLTEQDWDQNDWQIFLDWIKDKQITSLIYQRVDPNKYTVDVEADVFVSRSGNLSSIRQDIEDNLQGFFRPRLGSLGFSIYLNDIHSLIRQSSPEIDYIQLKQPNYPIEVDEIGYIILGNLSINVDYSDRSRVDNKLFRR